MLRMTGRTATETNRKGQSCQLKRRPGCPRRQALEKGVQLIATGSKLGIELRAQSCVWRFIVFNQAHLPHGRISISGETTKISLNQKCRHQPTLAGLSGIISLALNCWGVCLVLPAWAHQP